MAGLALNLRRVKIDTGQETDRLSGEFVISCFPPGPLNLQEWKRISFQSESHEQTESSGVFANFHGSFGGCSEPNGRSS